MSKAITDKIWVSFYINNLALWIAQQSLPQFNKQSLPEIPQLGSPHFTEQSQHENSQVPLAIHEHGLVYQANHQALVAGIYPGLGKASALSRCPQLLWIARDPQAESQYLSEQCWWLSRFTPHLCQEDGFLLAEVSRSLKLFGGLQALVQQMLVGFSDPQLCLKIAIACTARAAIWLSRWQTRLPSPKGNEHPDFKNIVFAQEPSTLRQALETIDINCLLSHTETNRQSLNLRMLRDDLALSTLKSLWDLPRKGLRQRLGAKVLLAMDQALGQEADPRTWLEIPEPLRLHRELSFWAEESSHLFKLGQTLIEQACTQLKARKQGLMAITFEFHHRDHGPLSFIKLGMQALCDEAKRWCALWEEHLAKTVLRDPVIAVSLLGGIAQDMPQASACLFPGPTLNRQLQTSLFERLQARLGRRSMFRIVSIADHRPELAQMLCEMNPDTTSDDKSDDKKPDHHKTVAMLSNNQALGLPRPIWFFDRPIPIQVRSDHPYWQGPLSIVAGPERIETGWWEGQWFARDYFIASDQNDVLYWLYRNRHSTLDQASHQWFIQGCFG